MQTENEGSEQEGTPGNGEERSSSVFIKHYRVITTLGRGSIGVTYKAEDTQTGELVIVKTLKSISLHDEAGNEQVDFTHDTWPVASLVHPSLVSIRDVGFYDESIPYVVFEYIDGTGLDVIIGQKGSLEPESALPLLRQVAAALDYAHSFSITHGNLKPGNILVTEDVEAMVIDLGIAELSSESVTPVGTVFGANSYLSPEQLHALPLDKYSDIFSFGLITFEILTGMHPFPGTSFNAIVSSVMNKPPITFQEMGSSLPPDLEPALLKAMEKEKEDRYSSCTEFIDTIAAIFKSEEPASPPDPFSLATPSEDIGSTLFGSDLESIVSEVKDGNLDAALEQAKDGATDSSENSESLPIEKDLLFEQTSRPRTASGTLTNIARMVAQDSLMQASAQSSNDSVIDDPMLDASRHQVKSDQSFNNQQETSPEVSDEEDVDTTLFGAGGLVSDIQDTIASITSGEDLEGTLYGTDVTASLQEALVKDDVKASQESAALSSGGISQETVEPVEEEEPVSRSGVPALRPERETERGTPLIVKLLVLAIVGVATVIGIIISKNPTGNPAINPIPQTALVQDDTIDVESRVAEVVNSLPDTIDSDKLTAANIAKLSDGQLAQLLNKENLPQQIRRFIVTEAGPREIEGIIPTLASLLVAPSLSEEEKLTILEVLNSEFYLEYEEVVDALITSLDSEFFLVRGYAAKVLSRVNLPFVQDAIRARLEIERNSQIISVIEYALVKMEAAPPFQPGH